MTTKKIVNINDLLNALVYEENGELYINTKQVYPSEDKEKETKHNVDLIYNVIDVDGDKVSLKIKVIN